ncbi:unnamed protein product, partial [Discosporangium mesarthrocarpum]
GEGGEGEGEGGEGEGGEGEGEGEGDKDHESHRVAVNRLHMHHHYQLRVAVLDTMGKLLVVLRALFRPPHSRSVQKGVAPLLDAHQDVLRDKAATVLGKLSLCGKDVPDGSGLGLVPEWINVAISVSLEAHSLLQEAWPDEGVAPGKVPPSKLDIILREHRLLPPLHTLHQDQQGQQGLLGPEEYVLALGRRFPALCKLLSTLLRDTLPRPSEMQSQEVGLDGAVAPQDDNNQNPPSTASTSSASTSTSTSPTPSSSSSSSPSSQFPFLVSVTLSLVERVLRMGQQATKMLEDKILDMDVGSGVDGADDVTGVSGVEGTVGVDRGEGVEGAFGEDGIGLGLQESH